MIEVIFLSIIQGVTEFLPISSSAHLILFSDYFNFNNANLTLDISLHTGSLLAIIFYYKKYFVNFTKNSGFLYKILISSIPTVIVGYFLVKLNLIEQLRNFKVIGCTTIIFGLVLFFADQNKLNKKINDDFTIMSAIYVGLFQMLSLIPGVSRSGITISAARILGFKREESAKISFLLSIPILASVTLYNVLSLYESGDVKLSSENLIAIFFSFIFSYLTIKYFLKYVKEYKLNIFVIYRIVLGTIILSYAYFQ
jgi:undecaprenyl-diphosphatase|tara:strand:+ start:116 stop:877 length:762 start_codon:yes stop_codon:yes gene_type:complete